jgi:hypothetical protein
MLGPVGSNVGGAVGTTVGGSLGLSDGSYVGSIVGEDGIEVGDLLGPDGTAVGEKLGPDGTAVGLGTWVGPRELVGLALGTRLGGTVSALVGEIVALADGPSDGETDGKLAWLGERLGRWSWGADEGWRVNAIECTYEYDGILEYEYGYEYPYEYWAPVPGADDFFVGFDAGLNGTRVGEDPGIAGKCDGELVAPVTDGATDGFDKCVGPRVVVGLALGVRPLVVAFPDELVDGDNEGWTEGTVAGDWLGVHEDSIAGVLLPLGEPLRMDGTEVGTAVGSTYGNSDGGEGAADGSRLGLSIPITIECI